MAPTQGNPKRPPTVDEEPDSPVRINLALIRSEEDWTDVTGSPESPVSPKKGGKNAVEEEPTSPRRKPKASIFATEAENASPKKG